MFKRKNNRAHKMLSLDNDIYSEFTQAADSQGMTYSDVIEDLLSEYTKNVRGEQPEAQGNNDINILHYETLQKRYVKPLIQHIHALDSQNAEHLKVIKHGAVATRR